MDDIIDLLEFVRNSTFFSFQGQIYEQIFETPMGSPVSPIVANLFMEDQEQRALQNCPTECKPLVWYQYVDDIYEAIPKGTEDQLTAYLNTVDPTDNIQFTCKVEQDKKLPMLDVITERQTDGSLKTSVYRKKTHTDQYLNFESHQPLHQRLGVVRTLLD